MNPKKKTVFALRSLRVAFFDGTSAVFWFDGNSKVTWANGTFDTPIANSFSLLQIVDCPFATETCKSACYVHNLEKAEADLHAKYAENSIAIRRVLENPHYRARAVNSFVHYIREHCAGGFRWHVSGDIFSLEYARFIHAVVVASSAVPQWIYTRSFQFVDELVGIPNLVVNLSADKDNFAEALAFHEKYCLRICYLSVKGEVPLLPKGSVIFPSYGLRGRDLPTPSDAPWWRGLTLAQKQMVCPPDFFGQNDSRRCGPCKKCLKHPMP